MKANSSAIAEDVQPLAFTSIRELYAMPDESEGFVVDGLLPTGGLSILAGKPKAGKSTLARQLCAAVAQGHEFLGRSCEKGTVLYLALEEKRSEITAHFRDMGMPECDDLKVLCASVGPSALQCLALTLKELSKARLVVIDPVFKFIKITDGNDYMKATDGLEPLLALARDSHAHILAVHHLKKRESETLGDNILGSTAIYAAVDTFLALSTKNDVRTLASSQRYGEPLTETQLIWNPESRTLSLGSSMQESEYRDNERMRHRVEAEILAFVAGHPQCTREAIFHGVIGKGSTKHAALKGLLSDQKLIPAGAGTKGAPILYSIAPLPSETAQIQI